MSELRSNTNSDATTSRAHDVTNPEGPTVRTLTRMQKVVLVTAIAPMIVVGVAGGIGTFTNISGKYGDGTAVGALAAGEGATAVLALVLLVTTLLGQSAPTLVRAGLWVLPASASAMAATAADGVGQTIVYGLTPMAITAAAEGIAFLTRRVVIHQEGRDVEAEARAAAIVRDLAYHQARADSHPAKWARKVSVRKSWRLARKVGGGDVRLGADLMDIQRERIGAGADAALARMFGGVSAVPALASADPHPALPAASTSDVMDSRAHDVTIPTDTSGYPTETDPDQAGDTENIRPDLKIVSPEKDKKPSIAADVRQMVADGVKDVSHVLDAIASRHERPRDDQALKSTVNKYFRDATKAAEDAQPDVLPGQYL